MIFSLKNKITMVIRLTLLAVLISNPVNAATMNTAQESGIYYEGESITDAVSNRVAKVNEEQQEIDQVKTNFLSVLELLEQNDYQTAKAKVTALIQQAPDQFVYYNLQAMLQLVKSDISAAEQSFLKSVELNTNNTQALIGLAKLTLDKKQFDKAKGYANQALAINPYDVKAYLILADVTQQQQGTDAVEILLLDAQRKVKGKLMAELAILQSLGKVYLIKNKPEKLLQLASDLNKRNKNDSAVLSFLAEAQLINKDEVNAEKTLRKIVSQQPNDIKHLFLLARLLGKQKHYKEAFSIAQKIESHKQGERVGKALKADVYLAQKNYPAALLNYQRAYAISPEVKVLDGMLKILELQNKTKQAVTLLETEQAKYKDNSNLQFRLAVAYQKTGQYALSAPIYEALLSKEKDNVIVLNNLAFVYSKQNNPQAIILAKQAYKLAPKSGVIADTYGYLILKQGSIKESIKILKVATELDPMLVEIKLHLAEAYMANQDKTQAKKTLQKVLQNKKASHVELSKTRQMLLEI